MTETKITITMPGDIPAADVVRALVSLVDLGAANECTLGADVQRDGIALALRRAGQPGLLPITEAAGRRQRNWSEVTSAIQHRWTPTEITAQLAHLLTLSPEATAERIAFMRTLIASDIAQRYAGDAS